MARHEIEPVVGVPGDGAVLAALNGFAFDVLVSNTEHRTDSAGHLVAVRALLDGLVAREGGDDPDWSAGLTIEEMPVTSAICVPGDGDRIAAGRVRVAGYATAYARDIARVELSVDGGESWTQAAIERRDDARWSWVRWSADADLAAGAHRLVVRAVDSAGQGQPADPAQVWNFAGYLSTAWHGIAVTAA